MSLHEIDGEVGRALRAHRSDISMSQEELSAEMQSRGFAVSQATIGKIERGERKVTFGEALALAESLGVEILALTREPSQAPADVLYRRLDGDRTRLKESLRDYEAGQRLAAMEADHLEVHSAALRHLVLESVEEVVAEYRLETTNEQTAARRALDDRMRAMFGVSPKRDTSGLVGAREAKFGATVYEHLPGSGPGYPPIEGQDWGDDG